METQKALELVKRDWLEGPARRVIAELGKYADGAGLDACHELASLMTDHRIARELVSALQAPMADALRGQPLGHVPFRHQLQNGLGILQLVTVREASLSLVLYEERDAQPVQSVCFTDSDCQEIVLAGAGHVTLLEKEDQTDEQARLHQTTIAVKSGSTLRVLGRDRAKIIREVAGRMVVFRLSRTPTYPGESREYQLSTGVLLHRASGDRRDSRHEMFAGLLGAMGRADASPVLAQLAREGGDQIRWQALRNCLALDTRTGFSALMELSEGEDDPLAAPARTLRDQLLAAHPQLRRLERQPCPA